MADLLNLDEAAQLLNLTNDELVSFTDAGDIKSYRDGEDLKFKQADLEQFAKSQGIEMVNSELLELLDDDEEELDNSDATHVGDPLGLGDDSFSLLDDDMEGDGEDSVLITKQDLDALEGTPSSEPAEDLELADSDSLELEDSQELLVDDMDFNMEDDSTIIAPAGLAGLGEDEDALRATPRALWVGEPSAHRVRREEELPGARRVLDCAVRA